MSGPWAIFMPDGTFDGGIWSPKTLEDAQSRLAKPKRWTTLEREGWVVREVTREEFRSLMAKAIAQMEATP